MNSQYPVGTRDGLRRGPSEVAERLYKDANGRKDDFMAAIKMGGWNRDLAQYFGTSERGEFEDAASSWFDRKTKLANGPVVEIQPMRLSEVGLVRDMRTEEVLDPKGRRDATLFIHPGTTVSEGDMRRIRTAVVSEELVAKVTEQVPAIYPKLFPWQRGLEKRTVYTLPEGHTESGSTEYVYYGKGLKFVPGQKGHFDLLAVRRDILGEEISDNAVRADISFDETGLMSMQTRPKEVMMGQDFEKAEHEYSMMLLARQRGLAGIVDEPVVLGRFKTLAVGDRSIGFLFSRQYDLGQRGDAEIYSMNNNYRGRILAMQNDLKNALIGEFVSNIDTYERDWIDNGRLVRENEGLIRQEEIPPLKRLLEIFKGEAKGLTDSKDPRHLAHLPHMVTWAQSVGVKGINFLPLIEKAEPRLIHEWGADIESMHFGQGIVAKRLFDQGISHEQPHLGNLRYKHTSERRREVIVCDWHDGQDLSKMTYPQALGYVANSMRTLLSSSAQTENLEMLKPLGTKPIRRMLQGLTQDVSGPMEGLIDSVIDATLTTDPALIARKTDNAFGWTTRNYLRSYIDAAFYEAKRRPITDIDHPLIELAKKVYPPSKHREIQTSYGAA
jgi:hypothetical protein